MKPIVIYGAGGLGREVRELIRDINARGPHWNLLGFLDDDPSLCGTALADCAVLGDGEWLDSADTRPFVVLAVGSPSVRKQLATRIRKRVAGFPAIIHPTTVHGESVRYGEGVIILGGCVLTADVVVGDFTVVNPLCSLAHDNRIGAYTLLGPGVKLAGSVIVGEGCTMGVGSKAVPGVEIGEWSTVGAGAIVTKDLPSHCTAVGVPARPIKQREPGWSDG